jgi:hypothetical protein
VWDTAPSEVRNISIKLMCKERHDDFVCKKDKPAASVENIDANWCQAIRLESTRTNSILFTNSCMCLHMVLLTISTPPSRYHLSQQPQEQQHFRYHSPSRSSNPPSRHQALLVSSWVCRHEQVFHFHHDHLPVSHRVLFLPLDVCRLADVEDCVNGCPGLEHICRHC